MCRIVRSLQLFFLVGGVVSHHVKDTTIRKTKRKWKDFLIMVDTLFGYTQSGNCC